MSKLGRNDLCGCGSGKKYKKCCLPKEELLRYNTNIQNSKEVEEDFALGQERIKELETNKPFIT